MAQLMEFASANLMLVAALAVITALIIKTEIGAKFSKIKQLNVNDAVRLINADDTVILDVRESSEYSAGHIRDAINIPMSALVSRLSELEKHKNKQVLAYCRSGNRSNSACGTLNKQGFDNVSNLAGGMMGWSSANLPVTKK